jgi:hypothetical protein
LRAQLDARYSRVVDTTDPDVIPYRRRSGDADYVFLVNDRREYGQYVGQHGIVMENGLPSEATISVKRSGGFVYDLAHSRTVRADTQDGKLTFASRLGPCDGALYLVCDQAIDTVRIEVPSEVRRGEQASCLVSVVDSAGRPIAAVVPVKVEIRDPEGRRAEFSGFYGAADGQVKIGLDLASNDPFGVWQISVREQASGQTATNYFRVASPAPWPPAGEAIPGKVANPVQPKG